MSSAAVVIGALRIETLQYKLKLKLQEKYI